MTLFEFSAFVTVEADTVEDAHKIAGSLNGSPVMVSVEGGLLREVNVYIDDGEPTELDDE